MPFINASLGYDYCVVVGLVILYAALLLGLNLWWTLPMCCWIRG